MTQLQASSRTRVSDMTRTILRAYDETSALDRAEGAGWYPKAYATCVELAERYGHETETAIAVLAVLSPRVRWSVNVRAAEVVLSGGNPRGLLNRSVQSALAIMDEPGRWWNHINGPKTSSFKHVIEMQAYAPVHPWRVVIDTWAVRAATNGRYDAVAPCRYDDVEQAYRNAADRLGLRSDVLQATLWVWARGNGE